MFANLTTPEKRAEFVRIVCEFLTATYGPEDGARLVCAWVRKAQAKVEIAEIRGLPSPGETLH
jgi:hypothetical protein